MPNESSVSRFAQEAVRGRNLIYLAVADVVLFLIANVAYGAGDQHGLRNTVSNVTWVLFLLGVVLLIVFGIIALGQLIWRRGKARGAGGATS
jgi:Na+-driven multidrug efflux pump